MTNAEHTSHLVARLRRRERWLLALAAVRSELLSGGSVGDALQLIAERAATLTEADGVLVLLADGGAQIRIRAASGPLAHRPDAPHIGASVPSADPWAGAVTAAVGTFGRDAFPEPRGRDLLQWWHAVGAVLVAPIPASAGESGAVLCLRTADRSPFDADTQPELVGLAEQASLALDIADRQEQRRLYELMADRERIARDLHDHVIQRLFAVGLSLQSQVAKIEPAQARERVDAAVQQIDEAIADLRSSIFNLRAAPDGARGKLRRRLAEIAAGVGGDGPRVTVRCHGPVDTVVSPQLAEQAEAVVREAVSNAVRHSGGTAVTVSVTAADRLDIEVADNGKGIDEAVEKGIGRSGLANLADRAAACGGRFEVVGGPGGTTVRWCAPLGVAT